MKKLLGLTALTTTLFALPQTAQAGIEACGDIQVSAEATCEVRVGVECQAQCEPVNFTAACYADCSASQCNVSASATCTGSCEAECTGQCEVDPGNFDCNASCEGQCGANCSADCAASDDQASCQASCEATCTGECGASCEGTPPEATCEGKCEASCNGQCSAEANVDCQIDCQGGCTAELTGGCEVQCQNPDGALFCDGQYVDAGGNLQECINALEAALSITVDVSARGSAACEGNTCAAEGEVSAGCSAAGHRPSGPSTPWYALGLVGLGLAFARRRH